MLVMNDGRLGLIDYGVTAEMSVDERRALAQILIAITEKDEDGQIIAMKAFGISSKKLNRLFMVRLNEERRLERSDDKNNTHNTHNTNFSSTKDL